MGIGGSVGVWKIASPRDRSLKGDLDLLEDLSHGREASLGIFEFGRDALLLSRHEIHRQGTPL